MGLINYLAHVLLSRNDIDFQLGNLLADPLKGKLWVGAGELHRAGMLMHTNIDTFTDTNEWVKKSKSRFCERKYLKGVVVDVVYDYLLLKNWNHFVSVDSSVFISNFYSESISVVDSLPEAASSFVRGVVDNDILSSYSTLDGLMMAFDRIDSRLSPRLLEKESTVSYMELLECNIVSINNDFLKFFPLLISYCKGQLGVEGRNEFLK